MQRGGVLYDRKAEAGAADLLGVALVNAVEALENALLLLGRNADAVILDRQQRRAALAPDVDFDKAAGAVVFDGVFAEIVNYRVEKLRNAVYDGALAAYGERNLRTLGRLREVIGLSARDGEQIDVLALHILRALVEVRKLDDVLDQRDHTLCLGLDLAEKMRNVLGLDDAVCQKLRAAGDGVQRRLQLVRDVGGELAAQLLGLLLLGGIEHQEHGAGDLIAGGDGACVEPVAHTAEARVRLAVLAAERLFAQLAQLRHGADGADILADAVAAYVEDVRCRAIDAQHVALLVEQNQTLGHVAGRGLELVAAAAQLGLLLAQLILLASELIGQRLKLGVGLDPVGIVKAQLVEGPYDAL